MTPDDFDRVLSSEELLEPSSGFLSNVMDAVRMAAEEPAPVAFPWVRFLTGVAACVAMAIAAVMLLLNDTATVWFTPLVFSAISYSIAALLITIGAISLPRVLS